jgi:hypothetical protein
LLGLSIDRRDYVVFLSYKEKNSDNHWLLEALQSAEIIKKVVRYFLNMDKACELADIFQARNDHV